MLVGCLPKVVGTIVCRTACGNSCPNVDGNTEVPGNHARGAPRHTNATRITTVICEERALLAKVKRLPLYQKVKTEAYKRLEALIATRVYNHESARRLHALADSAEFAAAHMKDALAAPLKGTVMGKSLEAISLEGLVLEFGVWRGTTINRIADHVGSSEAGRKRVG
jgi:hypothetical protein